MLTKLINFIKEHKGQVLIIGALLLLLFIFLSDLDSLREDSVQNPVVLPVDELSPGKAEGYVDLVEVYPEGPTNFVMGNTDITFTFNHAIDPESVKVKIVPHKEVRIFVPEELNNKVILMPDKGPWQHYIEYRIEIISLRSTEGYKLRNRASTTYLNTPPPWSEIQAPY